MKVVLENISVDYPQKSWVPMALPKDIFGPSIGTVTLEDGRTFPTVCSDGFLFVNAHLKKGEVVNGKFSKDRDITAKDQFKFSDFFTDELHKVVPSFKIQKDGIWHYSPPIDFGNEINGFKLIESNPARQVWELNASIPSCEVTIKGWFYIYSDQDHVEFKVHSVYGKIGGERKLYQNFGSLQMITGENISVDFTRRLGLKPSIYVNGFWETELVSPRTWKRACRQEVFGSMLCLPPYDKIGGMVTDPAFQERWNNLTARQQAPIMGFCDEFDANYLSIGKIPSKVENPDNLVRAAYYALLSDVNRSGDSYAERKYAQPPNAGQTGEHDDFGVSKLELVLTYKRPVFIWEYMYAAMAWSLRPYANKESNGKPVKAINHPNAKTYNLRPDERFSRADMLGWPDPVPFFEQYSTSDDQHRTDNLLLGLYQITKDHGIRDIILDIIELEKMNVILQSRDAPIGSPRGWGRPLLSMSHMYSLGFTEVEPMIRRHVSYLWRNASFRKIPNLPDRTVKVLADNEFKYGWLDSTNTMVRSWLGWQEAIAAIGLWAAWNVLHIEEARVMAITISETICKHSFYQEAGRWVNAYSVRWDTNNPGRPLPDSSYFTAFPEGSNKDVYAYPMQRWQIPALKLLIDNPLMTTQDVTDRARSIVNFFVPSGKPRDLSESGWWAI